MKRKLRIGMDVHSTNYILCAIELRLGEEEIVYADIKVTPVQEYISTVPERFEFVFTPKHVSLLDLVQVMNNVGKLLLSLPNRELQLMYITNYFR